MKYSEQKFKKKHLKSVFEDIRTFRFSLAQLFLKFFSSDLDSLGSAGLALSKRSWSVNLRRLAIYWPGCVFWAFLWLLLRAAEKLSCLPCLTCILLVRTELLYHTVRSRTGQKRLTARHCVKQQWPSTYEREALEKHNRNIHCWVNNDILTQHLG